MSQGTMLLTTILDQTDKVIKSFVFDGYYSLVTYLAPVVITLSALMVAGFGFAIMRGMIQTPISHAMNVALKYAVVVFLATKWSFFSEMIYVLFTDGPNELTGAIMNKASFNWTLFKSHNVNGALQEGLNQGMEKAVEILRLGSWKNFSPYIVGILAGLAILLICGFSMGMLVLAKAGLGVCLVLSPIFLLCFMFESTKAITEKWMQHLIGFALMPIGIHCVLMLILTLMDSTLSQLFSGGQVTFATGGAYILLSIISLPLLLQVKGLIASISSGFSFSTMGAVGNSLHYGGKFASGAKQVYSGAVRTGERVGEAAKGAASGILSQLRRAG